MRPLIVNVPPALAGLFDGETKVGLGVSYVNELNRVPTVAETVSVVEIFDPDPELERHLIVVGVFQLDVEHGTEPRAAVGVASSAAKLKPLSVTDVDPAKLSPDIATAVSTGASNDIPADRVPTTAEIVMPMWREPLIGVTEQLNAVVEIHAVHRQLLLPIRPVGDMSHVTKFAP